MMSFWKWLIKNKVPKRVVDRNTLIKFILSYHMRMMTNDQACSCVNQLMCNLRLFLGIFWIIFNPKVNIHDNNIPTFCKSTYHFFRILDIHFFFYHIDSHKSKVIPSYCSKSNLIISKWYNTTRKKCRNI